MSSTGRYSRCTAPIARVRPTAASRPTVRESTATSIRETAPPNSTSPSGSDVATSTTVTASRTESAPAETMDPITLSPAPVLSPTCRAEATSARPDQFRITVVGDTTRSGPAPLRLRESISIKPSRQSWRPGPRTSNGATATRLASSLGRRPHCDHAAQAPPRSPHRPAPPARSVPEHAAGAGDGDLAHPGSPAPSRIRRRTGSDPPGPWPGRSRLWTRAPRE